MDGTTHHIEPMLHNMPIVLVILEILELFMICALIVSVIEIDRKKIAKSQEMHRRLT